MKRQFEFPNDIKWNAIVNCDKNFDGAFIYGVNTTGVFCRPSCKSKTPLRSNVVVFDSANAAIKAGFRPCKRCCPEQIFYNPTVELAEKAKDTILSDFNTPINLDNISAKLGISSNYLCKLFKELTGLTPLQYITKIRIEKAKELLIEEKTGITELAYKIGFDSISNFYKCFKAQVGIAPKQYRRNRGVL